jgi:hypothetical protein
MKRKVLLFAAGLVLVLLPFNAFAVMRCQGGSLADSGCGYSICFAGGSQCQYCEVQAN